MARVRVGVDKRDATRLVVRAQEALSPPKVTDAVRAAAEVYAEGIARRAPRRSGRLAGSFEVRTLSATEAEASSGLVYARPQESGAFIRAKGRALRFTGAGGVRYLKWVRVKPQPYVAPTFASDSDKAFEAFCDHVDQSI